MKFKFRQKCKFRVKSNTNQFKYIESNFTFYEQSKTKNDENNHFEPKS